MALDSMNVSLPHEMKGWVEQQAKGGSYANASEYVRDLIRRDQERATKVANMQVLVDEGLASGVSTRSVEDIRADGRGEAAKRGV